MEIYLKKIGNTLVAADEINQGLLDKYRHGDEVKAKITKPRNSGFHRKFFSLINLAFENQEQYDSLDIFRSIIIMKAGFYQEVQTDKGLVFLPKSISFSNMEQAEFEDLYSKVLDVIIKLLGVTQEEFENELINYI